MSNLLREKHSLAKLRKELKGRKRKSYRYCKRFGHLARNCKNKEGGKKGTIIPQNKFEVLKSRVIQCRVEERIIRRHEAVVVECFKCGEKGHKCREYPLWKRTKEERKLRRVEEEEVVCAAKLQEAQQGKKEV